MFIKNARSWYTADGQQCASGAFLLLVHPDDNRNFDRREIRALVRHVRIFQSGHFMMGTVKIGPHELTVSGSYGGDGLTMDVPREVWEHAVPVPDELIDAWCNGGGWNSAGAEAPAMKAWALENLSALRRPWRRGK